MSHYLEIRTALPKVVTWYWQSTTMITDRVAQSVRGAGLDQVRRQLRRGERDFSPPRYKSRKVGNELYWRTPP